MRSLRSKLATFHNMYTDVKMKLLIKHVALTCYMNIIDVRKCDQSEYLDFREIAPKPLKVVLH